MDDRDRRRAQKVILAGYAISAAGAAVESIWSLSQYRAYDGSSIFQNVTFVVTPLALVASAFAFWWLAQIAVESPRNIALRKVIIWLAVQTFLTSLGIVVYYAFIDRVPISNQLNSSIRWITIGSFFVSLGTVIAMVGYFLMLRALARVLSPEVVETTNGPPDVESFAGD
jgi:hypothetical protein